MALTSKSSLWHLFARLMGLAGFVAAIIGLIAWQSLGQSQVGQIVLWLGIAGVVLALFFEIRGLYTFASGRRSAEGVNAFVQVLLALALLVGVNVFSFSHYQRCDWTRDQTFTIKPEIREQLAKLRGQTDIIVFQRHLSFGQVAENKQDNYDAAAERKIVEKVKDIVEQFQELGPRFRVQVLDIQDEDYTSKLQQIRATSPDLADAIEKAPENSIFFHTQRDPDKLESGKVQRLAFHDIYQLNREASKSANNEQGNLVLSYQGIEPFARKILNIEEKQPRVALAVIHPFLSLSDDKIDFYTMNGAKKVFDSFGFKTQDIILRSQTMDEPTAFTFDENEYETLDELRIELEESEKELKKRIQLVSDELKLWQSSSLEELNKKFIYVGVEGRYRLVERPVYDKLVKSGRTLPTSHVDDKDRQRELQSVEASLTVLQLNLEKEVEPELKKVREQQKKLNIENLEEQRRITDVKTKMRRLLADVDLLIVPRLTMVDLPKGWVIGNEEHKLDPAQFAAVKEFMKAGKPVLFCLSPSNERPQKGPSFGTDSVEDMLQELGFKLPKQAILHMAETKAFAQRRGGIMVAENTPVEVPPVQFEWKTGTGIPGKQVKATTAEPHPIRTSLGFLANSLGKSKELDVRIRYLRPVYYLKPRFEPEGIATVVALATTGILGAVPPWIEQNTPKFEEKAVFMMSDKEAWNEDNPFPTREKTPRYKPAEPDDPNLGTLLERRQGPLPVAAAAVVELPRSWTPERSEEAWAASIVALAGLPLHSAGVLVAPRTTKETERLAVVGSGAAFVGKNLTPVQQKLLLDLSNWLLGRDDLLARNQETWEYPRVAFSETSYLLWQWFTRLGLPVFFVVLGATVLLVRQMR